jgi:hypothetical protein
MLARHSFVPLTRTQFRAFNQGKGDIESGLHPYLVRGVGVSTVISAWWDGSTPEVIGDAMGECTDLANRPAIVLLEKAPQRVFVETVGAD